LALDFTGEARRPVRLPSDGPVMHTGDCGHLMFSTIVGGRFNC